MSNLTSRVPIEFEGERIDKAASQIFNNLSRSYIQKTIKNGSLKLNNKIISDFSFKVKHNDMIEITLLKVTTSDIEPANIPLDIVFEDSELMVVNKQAGLTTHPGAGAYQDTLVNSLVYHSQNLSNGNSNPNLSDIGGEIRPGIVHRLDRDTSGLMVIAKNNESHINLANQIKERSLTRRYLALVFGVINP